MTAKRQLKADAPFKKWGGANQPVWSPSARKASAIALAILALMPGMSAAISLGRVQVQSALGEPLRAEIDVADLSAEEASSLQVSLATPEQFRTAGLEYNPALTSTRIALQKRSDGRTFLSITGDKTVNDPFVDMIVEVSWSAGRIVRDYTLLFDPRGSGNKVAVSPQLATISPPPAQPTPAPAPAPRTGTITAVSALTPSATAKSPAPTKSATKPETSAQVQAKVVANPKPVGNLTVQKGDTAGKLAQSRMESGISLDQMLAAILRQNPDAFIGNDINRIKAGAVIDLPSTEQAKQISHADARKVLNVQSGNFAEYKKRVAQTAPTQAVPPSGQKAEGKVQAKVQDKAPTAAAADKLKLSKDLNTPATAKQEAIAKGKQTADAKSRTEELNKNVADLKKVAASAGLNQTKTATATPTVATPATPSKPASAAVPMPAVTASAAVAAAPTTTAALTPTATLVASGTTTSTSTAAKPTPTAVAPKPAFKAPPPPPPEPSFIDMLTENPMLPLGALGALVAALGGLVFWRRRKQHSSDLNVDSSFLESRLQPDSFFGASGGKQIDTAESQPGTGSSMMYSPSQLDAAGDVDPVAEAEVYIAYGRDLQAEEILKEALRTQGGRVAIHLKLLEIYAKRRDLLAFGQVASEVFDLVGVDSPDWQIVCKMGGDLDPSNALYQPGGKPAISVPSITDSGIGSASFAASTMPHPVEVAKAAQPVEELDLDLDLGLFDNGAPPAEPTVALQVPTRAPTPAPVDFAPEPAPTSAPAAPASDNALSFNMDDLSFSAPAPAPVAAKPAPAPMDFDMGGLSLELPGQKASAAEENEEDQMNTKLELAEEFFGLGDVDGARSIAQEVANEASGGLKAKAIKLLSKWV